MATVLSGLWHFYKSAASSGDLGNGIGLDVANLIIFVSINGGKFPYKSKIFQTNFTF